MSDPGLALLQSLPGASRMHRDYCSVDRDSIIFLLKSGNLQRGVARVGGAVTDTGLPGCKVNYEKKADKSDI
jgi:hypothetical protein